VSEWQLHPYHRYAHNNFQIFPSKAKDGKWIILLFIEKRKKKEKKKKKEVYPIILVAVIFLLISFNSDYRQLLICNDLML
jgi:hypothetical protein